MATRHCNVQYEQKYTIGISVKNYNTNIETGYVKNKRKYDIVIVIYNSIVHYHRAETTTITYTE